MEVSEMLSLNDLSFLYLILAEVAKIQPFFAAVKVEVLIQLLYWGKSEKYKNKKYKNRKYSLGFSEGLQYRCLGTGYCFHSRKYRCLCKGVCHKDKNSPEQYNGSPARTKHVATRFHWWIKNADHADSHWLHHVLSHCFWKVKLRRWKYLQSKMKTVSGHEMTTRWQCGTAAHVSVRESLFVSEVWDIYFLLCLF